MRYLYPSSPLCPLCKISSVSSVVNFLPQRAQRPCTKFTKRIVFLFITNTFRVLCVKFPSCPLWLILLTTKGTKTLHKVHNVYAKNLSHPNISKSLPILYPKYPRFGYLILHPSEKNCIVGAALSGGHFLISSEPSPLRSLPVMKKNVL